MRIVAGLLLVGAAILKAVELISGPTATMVLPFGRFLTVQTGFEFVIGLLVLSGVYWRKLRWLIVLLFSTFAAYSLHLAVNGAASCGCFGPVSVSPWWTSMLDLAVVFGLVVSSIHKSSIGSDPIGSRTALIAVQRKLLFVALAAIVVVTALLTRSIERRTAAARGLSTTGDLVILEPDQWVGKKLPIADFLDADLSRGKWLAVLHRHDCPVCQEVLPLYEQRALIGEQIALIDIPPYGRSPHLESTCLNCRLKDDREWFVQTPVEIELQDGIVVTAKHPINRF